MLPITPSNNAPTQSGEIPANTSTGISVTPQLYVLCKDNDADNMNATWWSNSSGSWLQFASNSTATGFANNTNITQSFTNASAYSTTYYWSLNLTDGTDWTNETYHFTTVGANKEIISKGQNAYSLEMNPGGTTLYGYINGNSISTSIDSNWHYVTITYDNTDLKIYKDGRYIKVEITDTQFIYDWLKWGVGDRSGYMAIFDAYGEIV